MMDRSRRFLNLVTGIAAGLVAIATPVHAADISFTGTAVASDSVELFSFSVLSGSSVTLRTWSYAGGVNAAGTTVSSGGFDPIISLFNASGTLIGFNDDGAGTVAVDPASGAAYDSYISASLAPGNYLVSLTVYPGFGLGTNLSDGFEPVTSFNGRSSDWAIDLLNVESAQIVQGAVPEPAGWALLLAGFAMVGQHLRRRRPRRVMVAV